MKYEDTSVSNVLNLDEHRKTPITDGTAEPTTSTRVPRRMPSVRGSTVAKVSHTLKLTLAERLEEFAFRQRVSESSVIEYALERFFNEGDDETLGERLRSDGAGRRRKT